MTAYLAALLLGVIAGLRAMTPLAAVGWAAGLGVLNLAGGPLAFVALPVTRWVLTGLAAAELVTDKLPVTPSRKVPPSFAARILTGAASGAAVGLPAGAWLMGAGAGALGAVAGTLGGAAARARLAAAFRRDFPAALLEDVVAVGGAALVVAALL
jgi:uncharacterized membrane protein